MICSMSFVYAKEGEVSIRSLEEILARKSCSVVVLGTQWGDERKGAVIDYLADLPYDGRRW